MISTLRLSYLKCQVKHVLQIQEIQNFSEQGIVMNSCSKRRIDEAGGKPAEEPVYLVLQSRLKQSFILPLLSGDNTH